MHVLHTWIYTFLFSTHTRGWRTRLGALALAACMLAGVLAPFVATHAASIVLVNREARVVAQGSADELTQLVALQRSNTDLCLRQYTPHAARQQVAGMPVPGLQLQVCADVPTTLAWDVPLAPEPRNMERPWRACAGCNLRIRHYG
jgi:hypothetical protein